METRTYLYWLFMAACLAYAGYEAYSYTGLYRLAAEWQMSTFGSYSEKFTFLLPLLALWIPGILIAKALGAEVDLRKAPPITPHAALTAGLVLLVVATGAGWYGYEKATTKVTFDAFDLSNGKAPPSNHVVMTGVAHTEYQVEFEKKRGEQVSIDRYVPVTAADWRRGDPLVYFMKTKTTAYVPPAGGKSFEFSRRTPPFPITQQGILIDNGLPGPVAEIYRNDGTLAPAPVLLDPDAHADAMPYFVTAGVGGLFGFWCLVIAAVGAFRQWRRA